MCFVPVVPVIFAGAVAVLVGGACAAVAGIDVCALLGVDACLCALFLDVELELLALEVDLVLGVELSLA